MKILNIFLFLFLSSLTFAQIDIRYLNDVPESFKEKYYSKPRNYNPLQVGNMWQYYYEDNNEYWTTKVVKDSLINGKIYFKKIHYEIDPPTRNFISWERNDTLSGVSFMLDFEDVNNNEDFLEELPLDSLENPYWSRYKTYKYSFNNPFFWSGEKTTLVKDTSWVIIEGDTVISRYFEILELFWGEEIAEGFGILYNLSESPIRWCTGAIINGKQYGTIVGVQNDTDDYLPTSTKLFQNYPNPFNPETIITYSLSKSGPTSLVIYNLLGERIKTLINQYQSIGNYSYKLNLSGLPSGIYIYTLISGNIMSSKKMLYLK